MDSVVISRFSAVCVLMGYLATLSLIKVDAGEMTFELPDKEKMCFHEIVKKGVSCVLEFQVLSIFLLLDDIFLI